MKLPEELGLVSTKITNKRLLRKVYTLWRSQIYEEYGVDVRFSKLLAIIELGGINQNDRF